MFGKSVVSVMESSPKQNQAVVSFAGADLKGFHLWTLEPRSGCRRTVSHDSRCAL